MNLYSNIHIRIIKIKHKMIFFNMKTKLSITQGSFWNAVATQLNSIPAVIQFRRTESYTGKVVREYARNTYRSCPEWLREPLKSAINQVQTEIRAKGLDL